MAISIQPFVRRAADVSKVFLLRDASPRGCSCVRAAQREQKVGAEHPTLVTTLVQTGQLPTPFQDPNAWGNDFDAIREHLRLRGSSYSFSSLLNWLSSASFGASQSQRSGLLARMWKSATRGTEFARTSDPFRLDEPRLTAVQEQRLQQLELLTSLSRAQLTRIESKTRALLDSDPGLVARRILEVRQLLPGCDLAVVLLRAPDVYLLSQDSQWAVDRQCISASLELLRERLAGAPLGSMIHEDPRLPLLGPEDLTIALDQLESLWGRLGPEVLADCEPHHLVLALKALGPKGPPRTV